MHAVRAGPSLGAAAGLHKRGVHCGDLFQLYVSAQEGARLLVTVRQYELKSVLGPLHSSQTRMQLCAGAGELNRKWRR